MRPTITEQLAGIAAILREEILPLLNDPFASSQLEAAATSLELIARSWGTAVQVLVEENAAIESLFRELRPLLEELNEPFGNQLGDAERSDRSQGLAFDSLQKRNVALRRLLEQLVGLVNDHPSELADIGRRTHEFLLRRVEGPLTTS